MSNRTHDQVLSEIVNELEALHVSKAFRVGFLVHEYAELRMREVTPIVVTISQAPVVFPLNQKLD